MRCAALLSLIALPALAECPELPDRADEMAALFTAAQAAPTEAAGRQVSAAMWRIWTQAPDAKAQELLDRGMAARSGYDLAGARAILAKLIAYCPDYAEGWNQRAFAAYLSGDFEAALTDLDRALALLPTHVAARSGRALTLMALGRMAAAQADLRAALTLNPWLPERAYLLPETPPGDL